MRRLPVLLVLAALCALPAQAFAAPTVVQFQPGPGPTTPRSVAAGPDGNVWFTDDKDPEAIGRITPGGAYDLFRTDVSHDGQQGEITAGPGGLWFTEANRDIIGRVSTSGVVREFPVSQGHPTGITAGPDGNLWFTAPAGDGAIARMTPSGAVTFIPVLTKGGSPASIAAGPDGNLWFTETGSRRIGRMTTQGDVAEFSTGIGGTPRQITAGPDGNLWFTETGVNPAIARITPSGTVTEFAVLAPNSAPQGITTGADGNLYFTDPGANQIGQITPSGTIALVSSGLNNNAGLGDITSGPDGRLWFTGHNAGVIGRMTVAPSAGVTSASDVSESAATLSAPVGPNSESTSYTFEYGTTTVYGQTTASMPAGSGSAAQNAFTALSGLSSNTAYHARVVATNATGTTYGPDLTFATTVVGAPSATTGPPSTSDTTSATIEGLVNPRGNATSHRFEWGTTSAYGQRAPASDQLVGSDSADHEVSRLLTGLTPNTGYHYRVVAISAGGQTTYGADQVFITGALLPGVTTGEAVGVTTGRATLFGNVTMNGTPTTYRFEWGTSTSYDHVAPALDGAVPHGGTAHQVNENVTDLEPATTYHFRLVATNSGGASYGADETFTTAARQIESMPGDDDTAATGDTAGPAGDVPVTSAPTSKPRLGKAVVGAAATGTVLVRKPGQAAYTELRPGAALPVGTVVDASEGTFTLTSALDTAGHTQRATFWGGRFTVHQPKDGKGIVELRLVGTPAGCAEGAAKAAANTKKKKPIRLWGQDNHGRFRTQGRFSAATVRGTKWLTTETCAGTRTTVAKGAVSVLDKVRHRTMLVRAGHSYLARRR